MADDGGRPARNAYERSSYFLYDLVDKPITWFRETIVLPNRKSYPYYHRKFNRVPDIDQCYEDEMACVQEAQAQFKRDKKVDVEIVNILRRRKEECRVYEYPDHREKCAQIYEDYEQAAENYFIKYGDLGYHGNVVDAFMKQKHRLIWERRHPKNNKEKQAENSD
ncbi:hypothetical protein CHUAL_011524 [Chamberlinius hualienensis]